MHYDRVKILAIFLSTKIYENGFIYYDYSYPRFLLLTSMRPLIVNTI